MERYTASGERAYEAHNDDTQIIKLQFPISKRLPSS